MRVIAFFVFYAAFVYVQSTITDAYVANESGNKTYKVMYEARPWQEALTVCESEGAKLAVPKTLEEFKFIQSLVRGMYYPNITGTSYKLLVWVGINNIDDYTVWKNVDGENIMDTGFHTWSGGNGITYSGDPKEPHCAGMDAANPGLRDWWCKRPQPYICEKIIDKQT